MDNNITIYQNGEIELGVSIREDTIWLTQKQIVELFSSSKANISEHIKHLFHEKELQEDAVVRKFRTTAMDGKMYLVKHYNLDVIISVGYRVNSFKATKFRQWATSALKQYIINGYAINGDKITHQRFKELEKDVGVLRKDMKYIKSKIKDDGLELIQGIFYDGQIYDAYAFVNDLLKSAKEDITLVDNFIDDTVLTLFSKYPDLRFAIITKNITKRLKLDTDKYNAQYKNLSLKTSKNFHDRFLIIDNDEVYHIGASLKDLGKKIFAFSRIDAGLLSLSTI